MSLVSPLQKLASFQEEIQFEVLRCLYQTPQISQRALARDLGVGLGTINFCFQAQVEKGLVKMQNFSQSMIIFDTTKLDETPRKLLDVSRMVALGWTHKVSLEVGVKLAYDAYLSISSKSQDKGV